MNFGSIIYVWMFGCPILVLYFILHSYDDEDILTKNINECKNGNEIRRHIRCVLFLGNYHSGRKSEILLKGYVYNHEENCTMMDCPLKKYKKYLDQGQQLMKHSSHKNHEGSKLHFNL